MRRGRNWEVARPGARLQSRYATATTRTTTTTMPLLLTRGCACSYKVSVAQCRPGKTHPRRSSMTTITTTQKHAAAAGSLLDPDSSQPAEPAEVVAVPARADPAAHRVRGSHRCSVGDRIPADASVEQHGRPLGRTRERVLRAVTVRLAGTRSLGVATSSMNTVPVIVVAALLTGILVLRRRIREAAFLVAALVVEITVFLSVTFVVARPRPSVPRLTRRRRRRASPPVIPPRRPCCSSAAQSSSLLYFERGTHAR